MPENIENEWKTKVKEKKIFIFLRKKGRLLVHKGFFNLFQDKCMDIIIGSYPPILQSFPERVTPGKKSEMVKAELLHVRRPRRGIAGPSGMERRASSKKDPQNGRVLTIMVPDGGDLPTDINTGDYQVMIRFTRK